MKKRGLIILGGYCLTAVAWAGTTVKTEVVEEQEKSETKVFCAKGSEKEAAAACQKWVELQSKSLGQRLLLSHCTEGELQTNNTGCLYKVVGELKYVLKKYRTETERNN